MAATHLIYLICVGISYLSQIATTQLQDLPPPQVTLELGTLRGFYQDSSNGRKIASFTSVPYVKQPMGRHRFKDSVEMSPWLGVYDATGEPPDCLQYPPSVVGQVNGSEDCLYLNVYTPFVPTGAEVKPLLDVLVYIHGGAFMYHGSRFMTPKYLLDKDIVLVTFNYRLGPLGFLSTGDNSLPGNAGMKDQVMALRWVQRYISSFGGDPTKVTLAGHSAGGAAVHYHLLSPLSKGLFNKAIVGSGSALNPWAKAEALQENTVALASKLGCAFQDTALMVKCLRSRPANHIAAFSQHLMSWRNMPMAPFAPGVEPSNPSTISSSGTPGPFLAQDPLTIITSGMANDVPVLFSYIPNEGAIPAAFFVFDDVARKELFSRWDELLPEVLDYSHSVSSAKLNEISQQIKQHYLGGNDEASSIEPIVQMLSDRLFISGIAESSRLQSQLYSSPVYLLRFTYKAQWSDMMWACNCTDNLSGALHYDDAGFLLDSLSPPCTSQEDKSVQTQLVDFIYSFMTSTNPQYGGVALPEVKTALPSLTYLDIDSKGVPSVMTEADPGQTQFWKTVGVPELQLDTVQSSTTHSEL